MPKKVARSRIVAPLPGKVPLPPLHYLHEGTLRDRHLPMDHNFEITVHADGHFPAE
jgi:hypothetical protein